MGSLYDYFSAPDDTTALTVFDPGVEAAGLPALPLWNIDPYVQLGQAESLLTGVPYADVTALPRFNRLLSSPEHDSSWLVTLTDELRDALASARPGQLEAVAEPWSRIEEFGDDCEPGPLADFLKELATLAAEAATRHEPHRLYCLMSL
ncbi:hypothetical protein ACIRP2_08670 [Streptomyces sp. NPDC101194]|uniref:hypothetical protein n=1 Tax=Streptomyces sp. NPDC101194 TaxID=3366127 RepID=UPI0038195456